MNSVEINKKTIYGLSVRTTNVNEMNPETAKIGKTWQKFDADARVDYQAGERVYGVYYNYESNTQGEPDANGEFDVLAGCEKKHNSPDQVIIQKGKYLVFEGRAKTPDDNERIQAVIATWTKIWAYFDNELSEHRRAYKTDFEYYKSPREVDIYISVV
ncbi:hypothetical protein MNBD_GAMMA10-2403 [hydrothermal vent metagenome]|uniref:AraC effector-binding domain-containing protein n=1 Tax=hydrothermal vent metagenome TaxID=652676 RepID=A0A3B0YEL0_9ZZZZ